MKLKPIAASLLIIPFSLGLSVYCMYQFLGIEANVEANLISLFFTFLGFILCGLIIKTFPKTFMYLLALAFISSCCPKITSTISEKVTIHDTTTIETRVKVIDTFIEKDTLTQIIQLECDSSGKVHIIENKTTKGKRSSVSSKLINNALFNTFTCDSLHIVNTYLDSLVKSYRLEKKEKETINNIIEYRMPWWGWILIGASIAFAIYSRFFK